MHKNILSEFKTTDYIISWLFTYLDLSWLISLNTYFSLIMTPFMLQHSLPSSHFHCLYNILLGKYILKEFSHCWEILVLPSDFFNMIIKDVIIVLDLELTGFENDFFSLLPDSLPPFCLSEHRVFPQCLLYPEDLSSITCRQKAKSHEHQFWQDQYSHSRLPM